MFRWWTFLSERFPPGSYLPLVAVFVVANVSFTGPLTLGLPLYIAPIVVLSYFLRLRCFDILLFGCAILYYFLFFNI